MAKSGSVVDWYSPCEGMSVAHVSVWMHNNLKFLIYLWYLSSLSPAVSSPPHLPTEFDGNVHHDIAICCILSLFTVIYFQYLL